MTLVDRLAERACVVADGAWWSTIRDEGIGHHDVASVALTHSGLITRIARQFLDAGADVISTHTFGANRLAAERSGIDVDRLSELNRTSAELVRTAVGDGALVAGIMGPTGLLVTVGEVDEAKLTDAFVRQAEALIEGGVDLLVFETFSELGELVPALRAVRAITERPIVACMSFDSGPQHTRTVMGVEAAEAAVALTDQGADLVGCNCGAGVDHALPAVFALATHTDRPIWVKPSVGLPDLVDGAPAYSQTPEEFVAEIPRLIEAGARVIGGCCGAFPTHIARLAQVVRAQERKRRR